MLKVSFFQKEKLKSELKILESVSHGEKSQERGITEIRRLYGYKNTEQYVLDVENRIQEISSEMKSCNEEIQNYKSILKELLLDHEGPRYFRQEYLCEKNIISVFESIFTRTLGLESGKVSTDLFIIRVYYYEIFKDLILNGFYLNGEKYICYTASAGQIRTKKVVFVKESVWRKYSKTLMCGLSPEIINRMGGVNTNKYLAYLALNNSATDEWPEFDIKKSIVVDDFETEVLGEVDFIDHEDYSIHRREMQIPINHMDGCGMVLPRRLKRNSIFRACWLKGLLAVFPFDKFIREANKVDPSVNHGLVTDIYGKEHDVIAEGVEIIFTKSQFKMWKFYQSWDQYIDWYQKYGCSCGICNSEETYLPNAKLNYQMLQTLTDITDDELRQLSCASLDKINKLASDKDTMVRVFGGMENGKEKNWFQKSLSIYPELLNDPYTKESLKLIKKRLIRESKAGKLDINGKYLYLIPDLYAFCEFLFLHNPNPKGLLKNGEVYSRVYGDYDKLDCLRSPHLYREHAIRINSHSEECRKWFKTKGLYTSCHDLISKLLQFDNDGDKSLVVADPLFVSIAERNMQGIVPLYYKMAKAEARELNNSNIYNGMITAYSGGDISGASNTITKMWDCDTGVNLDLIKLVCMTGNFNVDYAKTLYKPVMPDSIARSIKKYTARKVPKFFIYAKDKTVEQVYRDTKMSVNRLSQLIPNKCPNFKSATVGKLDYKVLMNDSEIEIDFDLVKTFKRLQKQYNFRMKDERDILKYGYVRDFIRLEMEKFPFDLKHIVDVLVKYYFHSINSKRKSMLWLCFGDIIYSNIVRNLGNKQDQCILCGKRYERKSNRQKYCKKCAKKRRDESKKNSRLKNLWDI